MSQSHCTSDFLRILHQPGTVFEVRIPNCRHRVGGDFASTHAGYFTDPDGVWPNLNQFEVRKPRGIYVTINPVAHDLYAQSAERIQSKVEYTTTDKDILQRTWFLLDIDSIRPKGVSATEKEMQAALELARDIRDALAADGWPDALLAMSGNGAYLFYRIDLPNDGEHTELVRRALHGLAGRYNTATAEIDKSTFNASRLAKLIGSRARKGDDLRDKPGMEDRPHRMTWYEPPSGPLNPVPRDLLESVAAEPEPNKPSTYSPSPTGSATAAYGQFVNYIAKCPDAISGHHGHDATFRVACEGFRFALTEDLVLRGLREFNVTKTGDEPWNDRELSRKVADAHKRVQDDGEFGSRVRNSDVANAIYEAGYGKRDDSDVDTAGVEAGAARKPTVGAVTASRTSGRTRKKSTWSPGRGRLRSISTMSALWSPTTEEPPWCVSCHLRGMRPASHSRKATYGISTASRWCRVPGRRWK